MRATTHELGLLRRYASAFRANGLISEAAWIERFLLRTHARERARFVIARAALRLERARREGLEGCRLDAKSFPPREDPPATPEQLQALTSAAKLLAGAGMCVLAEECSEAVAPGLSLEEARELLARAREALAACTKIYA